MNMRVTGSYPAGLTSPVDKRIGDAFPIIEEVHRYLDQLKYLAKNGEKFAGKQVEFRSNSEEKAIEWRYENGEWNVLVSFSELVGININSIEARVELLIETARQTIEQTAHQIATEAADAVSAQFTAVVEAQVASVEALKQETVDAYQAGLAAKVSAEEAAVTAATFAENADVSAAKSATSANEAEASANAAELSAQNAADLLAGVASVSPLLSRSAGETLSALTVVWEDAVGKVWPLTSADVAHAPLRLGVTTTAASTGAEVLVQRDGQLDTSGLSFLPGTVWVSASARLSQTPPTAGALIAVGAVVSSNRLYINFSEPIYL